MNTKEEEAYWELKTKIVKEMFSFTEKYAAKGENCLYPQCGQIMVNVLQDCLNEAKVQIGQ